MLRTFRDINNARVRSDAIVPEIQYEEMRSFFGHAVPMTATKELDSTPLVRPIPGLEVRELRMSPQGAHDSVHIALDPDHHIPFSFMFYPWAEQGPFHDFGLKRALSQRIQEWVRANAPRTERARPVVEMRKDLGHFLHLLGIPEEEFFALGADAQRERVRAELRNHTFDFHPDRQSPEERDAATALMQEVNEAREFFDRLGLTKR